MTSDEILIERLHEAMPNSPEFVESCERMFKNHAAWKKKRKGNDMSSEAATKFGGELLKVLDLLSEIVAEIERVYDIHQPNISASEALYAFSGHLCNLPNPIVLGRGCNAVRMNDLIEQFCKLNNLPEPREGWDKKLNPRFYKEVTAMDGNCVMHSQPLSLCPECQENMVKEMEKGKDEMISALRTVLIVIAAEDCGCEEGEAHSQCPRCRAVDILEETKDR